MRNMTYLLYIVQLLCLIYPLTHSAFVYKLYTQSSKISNKGFVKEFPITIPNLPGLSVCAFTCLQTTRCQSYTYQDSADICQLQTKGYGVWTDDNGKAELCFWIIKWHWKGHICSYEITATFGSGWNSPHTLWDIEIL